MRNSLFSSRIRTGKRKTFSTIFVVWMIFTITLPGTLLTAMPQLVSAQEASASETTPTVTDSSTTPSSTPSTPANPATTDATVSPAPTDTTTATGTTPDATTTDTTGVNQNSPTNESEPQTGVSNGVSTSGYQVSLIPAHVINGNVVELNGMGEGFNYVGTLNEFFVRIDWGDGVVETAATSSFQNVGVPVAHTFNGSWSGRHTYSHNGTYTISAYLYRLNPNSSERSATRSETVTIGSIVGGDGSITVCKIITDMSGNVDTSALGVAGRFDVTLDAPDGTPVATSTFFSQLFAPNQHILTSTAGGTNDAQCVTYDHLPLSVNGSGEYRYSQEAISRAATVWATPRYNDGYTVNPMGLSDFTVWDVANGNSDGIVTLSQDRPNRTVIILNQHQTMVLPCANNVQLNPDEYTNALEMGRVDYHLGTTSASSTNVTVSIINNSGCQIPVSFSSYRVFDRILSHQVLFDQTGLVVAPTGSTTTLTVNLDNCLTQYDAWYGLAPTTLIDSAPYRYPSNPFVIAARIHLNTGRGLPDAAGPFCTTSGGGGGNHPPQISLNGANPMNLHLHDVFVDPGATATDVEDGPFATSSIAVSGSVDTNTIGTYSLVYSVTDSGQLSASTTRTINVTTNGGGGGENHAPVITILGDNPMTVILNHDFVDPGATADDGEGHDITSLIMATGTVDTSNVGTYSRTYTVSDSQGLSDTETRVVNVERQSGGGGGGGGGRHHGNTSGGSVGNQPQVLGSETGPCVYLNNYLRQGLANDRLEVLKLQYFLKFTQGYSNLETTGTFDDATFNAVSQFQTKYADEVLTPWGYSASHPTGYVYILTKKKINEIVCGTTFPLTAMQAEEIQQFRNLLASSGTHGVAIGNVSNTENSYLDNGSNSTLGTNENDSNGSSGSLATSKEGSTATPLISLSSDNVRENIGDSGFRRVAGAIFSIPKDRGILLQSLYFLLIAIIAVYLFTEIIVGSRDLSKLNKYQIWTRKAMGYTIGLVIAIIAAIFYHVYNIVLPLLVLAIVAGAFWAWTTTKRTDTGSVINLPPSKNAGAGAAK